MFKGLKENINTPMIEIENIKNNQVRLKTISKKQNKNNSGLV